MKKDGGDAFPRAGFAYRDEGYESGERGMSLRDYFAAKVLMSIRVPVPDTPDEATFNALLASQARVAYLFADAMLAERSKP